METPRESRFSQTLLTVLRGPLLLYAISCVLLIAAVPAEAVLLQGYLQDEQSSGQELVPVASEIAPPAASFSLDSTLARDSFPNSFAGTWKCLTVVIDSAVASVEIGSRLESQVEFSRGEDGKVLAHWSQPGWTEAAMSVTALNDHEADLNRTNMYVLPAAGNSSWTAKSSDHYLQFEADQIAAVSSVDQFVNGEYLGRYRTKSLLVRIAQSPLAMK